MTTHLSNLCHLWAKLSLGAAGLALIACGGGGAGKDNKPGIAHYHVLLDKSLINMFCKPTATISMQNVKPGMHELAVDERP